MLHDLVILEGSCGDDGGEKLPPSSDRPRY